LDPRVLSQWTKEAKETPPLARGSMRAEIDSLTQVVKRVYLDSEDRTGKIEIYSYPDPKCRYINAIDPSQGNQDGDWTVGYLMCVETGDQVAEFRAKIDPDLAVDQLEYLSIWYNKALTAIEMNGGYGVPYLRHFADRLTVPIYERQQLDRITKQYTKRHGWLTSVNTRSALFAELKYAVRTESIKIRSLTTLQEARTLWENSVGKIEARPGHHDDGIMAGGIAQKVRNDVLEGETEEKEKERKSKSPVAMLNRQLKKQLREEKKPSIRRIKSKLPLKTTKRGGRRPLNRDKRRSRI
jgi:hypothetical protein